MSDYVEEMTDFGYKLANEGGDTRSLQHYLGHKNIQCTVVYTSMDANRFNGWWNE
jgi:site-specific recombinase XerD